MMNKTTIASVIAAAFAAAGCAGPAAFHVKPEPSVTRAAPSATASYELGRQRLAEHRYAQAISALQQTLHADPDHVDALNDLGVAYAALGQYVAAIKAFQAGIRLAPDKASLYNNLGYTLLLDGRVYGALVILEEAERLDPGSQKVKKNLAWARSLASAAAQRAADVGNTNVSSLPAGKSDNAPETLRLQGNGTLRPDVTPGAEFVQVSPSVYVLSRGNAAAGTPAPLTANVGAAGVRSTPIVTIPLAARVNDAASAEATADLADGRRKDARDASGTVTPIQSGATSPQDIRETDATMPASDRLEPRTRAEPASGPEPLLSGAELEISNGNGINGLARRVADHFSRQGTAQDARLTNHPGFGVPSTEVHYRNGFRDVADELRRRIHGQGVLVESEALRGGTNVRLLLGHDFAATRMEGVAGGGVAASTAREPTQERAESASWRTSPLSGAELEVSNGNGVARLAEAVADYFFQQGIVEKPRLTNQLGFRQERTEIRYRNGLRAAAEELQRLFPGPSVLVEFGNLRAGTNLRLTLGHDLATDQAALARIRGNTVVASKR